MRFPTKLGPEADLPASLMEHHVLGREASFIAFSRDRALPWLVKGPVDLFQD